MTPVEAFRELGVGPSATPDEIRRAYLRGVKMRKPEVDPEGFRRWREAYELLSVQPGREAPAPPVARPAGEEQAAPADPRTAWMEDLAAALGAEPDRELRIRRLRQAVREEPTLPEPRWWLARDLFAAKRPHEAAEVLRAGDAAGLPGFLRELARGFPSLLTPEEMERLAQSTDPGTLATLSAARARRGDGGDAAGLMQRAFNLADVQGDLANPSPWLVIQVLLQLQSQGALAASRTVFEQLYWRMASGRVAAALSGEQAALWGLVRELHELSPAFHQGARKAIADATLEGDPSQAARAVWEVARRCGEQNRSYAAMLQPLPILGPLFHEIFLRALPAQEAPPPPLPLPIRPEPTRPAPRMRVFGSSIDSRAVYILIAVFFVLGLIGTAMDDSPAPSSPRSAAPSLGGRAENAASLLTTLRVACPRDRLTADIVGACQQARTAFDALRDTRPDCTAAKAALFSMRANGISRQGPVSDLARQLSALYRERCPG
jgi:hypothetical protein